MKRCGSCFRCIEDWRDAKSKGVTARGINIARYGLLAPKPRKGVGLKGVAMSCPSPMLSDIPACEAHMYRWWWNIKTFWRHVICRYARRLFEICVRVPIGGLRKPVAVEWKDSYVGDADMIIPNGEPVCPHCGEMPYSTDQCVFCGQRFIPVERRCRVCGCTDEFGCPEGCWWVEDDLCSRCVFKEMQAQVLKAAEMLENFGAADPSYDPPSAEAFRQQLKDDHEAFFDE